MTRISHAVANGRHRSIGGDTSVGVLAKDRRVRSRAIVCPDCKAPIDSPCVTATGTETNSHKSRRRMALRAEGSEYSGADVDYARNTTPAQRRVARKRSGLTNEQIGALVGVSGHEISHWCTGTKAVYAGPIGARFGAWLREHLEGR